jgi:hypothetical protein
MDLPTFPSIGPEIWGRSFWEFLDAIVATFPKDNPSIEQRNAVRDLLQSLRYLLPCPTCRKHYNDFVNSHPLDHALVSRRSFVDFYFLLRKDVAGRTNGGFPYHSPDDLWRSITQRLKLTSGGIPPRAVPNSGGVVRNSVQQRIPLAVAARSAQKNQGRPPFRVPGRINNNATATATVKKGCGCGKR